MHTGDDQDHLVLDAVKEQIRKTLHQGSVGVSAMQGPPAGERTDSLDGFIERSQKLQAQLRPLFFVPIESLLDLVGCLWAKPDRPHDSFSRR